VDRRAQRDTGDDHEEQRPSGRVEDEVDLDLVEVQEREHDGNRDERAECELARLLRTVGIARRFGTTVCHRLPRSYSTAVTPPGSRIRTSTSGACLAASRANARGGSVISRGRKRRSPIGKNAPQWIGIATRGLSIRSAW